MLISSVNVSKHAPPEDIANNQNEYRDVTLISRIWVCLKLKFKTENRYNEFAVDDFYQRNHFVLSKKPRSISRSSRGYTVTVVCPRGLNSVLDVVLSYNKTRKYTLR